MSRKRRTRSSGTALKKALNPVLKPASTRRRLFVKPAARSAPGRIAIVDAARGFAITMMIAYHFCFDLTYHGWAGWRMLDDPRWIAWRNVIVTSFVFLVGVSLALREARGRADWFDRTFVRRWLQIAAAAALVTAGSMLLFPDRYIYFGVLHYVAVALWLCRRASQRPIAALALGVVVIVLGNVVAVAAFDPRGLDWIGFAATKPPTEDYVPLFPWLGVTLVGCCCGGLWARRDLRLSPSMATAWNALPSALRRSWAAMGRWSLAIYLVHQPIVFGAMGLIKRVA